MNTKLLKARHLLMLLSIGSMISISDNLQGQYCSNNHHSSETEEPTITAGFIGEYSLKALGKSDYMGMGVHAGIWAGSQPNWPNIGAFVGYVEYKVNDTTLARRSAALTLALRVKLIDEKLQISPYYSFLLGWQSDAGIRIGWKVQKGTYIGVVVSETMHYGITAMLSIF